jgi:hypothetical protein
MIRVMLFAVLSVNCFYSNVRADDGQGFYVQPADSSVDTKKIKLKTTVVPAPSQTPSQSHLPSLEERDQVFKKSGLTSLIKNFDSFDLDSLYLRLREKDDQAISRITKKYKNLEGHEANLKSAQNLIAAGAHHE